MFQTNTSTLFYGAKETSQSENTRFGSPVEMEIRAHGESRRLVRRRTQNCQAAIQIDSNTPTIWGSHRTEGTWPSHTPFLVRVSVGWRAVLLRRIAMSLMSSRWESLFMKSRPGVTLRYLHFHFLILESIGPRTAHHSPCIRRLLSAANGIEQILPRIRCHDSRKVFTCLR